MIGMATELLEGLHFVISRAAGRPQLLALAASVNHKIAGEKNDYEM